MLLCTVWLGVIGFLDDYFKIKARKAAQLRGEKYQKKDKDGLAGISKIIGQIGLGIIVGLTLYFNSNVTVEREIQKNGSVNAAPLPSQSSRLDTGIITRKINGEEHSFAKVKIPITTIPFCKKS